MRTIMIDDKRSWPAYAQIGQQAIREATANWDAAAAAREEAKKTVIALEQERPQAEWADAEASAAARGAGKPEPKRTHTAAHDKALEDARHEAKVQTIAERVAHDALQEACDQFGAEWEQETKQDLQTLDAEWTESISRLLNVHAQRAELLGLRAKVWGGEQPSLGTAEFAPAQLKGVDIYTREDQWGRRMSQMAEIATADLLAGLAGLVGDKTKSEPGVQTLPGPPLGPAGFPTFKDRGVDAEIAEREKYNSGGDAAALREA